MYMAKIIVTGGAGFIGSALVWKLNEIGQSDITIVDHLDHEEKEKNVAPLRYEELVSGQEFREKLGQGRYDQAGIDVIFHLAAISATTEKSWEKLQDNNVDFSQEVIRFCADRDIRCIYASSAATYGDGSQGYDDDHELFDQLEPLNLYGKSKLLVDIWARDAGYLEKVVGLRYFNVFGPNENHKGDMRSVINKNYPDVAAGKPIHLFKSYKEEYSDGGQKRDFIYVKDAIAATLFFWKQPEVNGVFNVGTGMARTWNDVAKAMFVASGQPEKIEYIDMPASLQAQYQYFTQADMKKLTAAGFKEKTMPLEDSVADYIQNYLAPDKHLGD
jgi:ADP-L-glycero-D-manno-heptose 6-epimerase